MFEQVRTTAQQFMKNCSTFWSKEIWPNREVAALIIVSLVMLTVWLMMVEPAPTLEEATQIIRERHPECEGQIVVEEHYVVGYGNTVRVYDAVCQTADVRIRIQKP